MVTLAQFGARMRKREGETLTRITKVKRDVGRAVLSAVVMATPIRTGRARFHWNVSMNAPDYSYEYASFEDFSRVGDWLGKMATSRVAILRATQKDDIYISNGLPYIGLLNRGYSPQAGPDYVRAAAIAGAQVVRRSYILR